MAALAVHRSEVAQLPARGRACADHLSEHALGDELHRAQDSLVSPAQPLQRLASTTNRVKGLTTKIGSDLYDGNGARIATLPSGQTIDINRVRLRWDVCASKPGRYFFALNPIPPDQPGWGKGWIRARAIAFKSGELTQLVSKTQHIVKHGKHYDTKMKSEAGPLSPRKVRGGRPNGFKNLRVTSASSGDHNRLAADYLPKGGRVNLCANYPEGQSGPYGPRGAIGVDLLPKDTRIYVSKRTKPVRLYRWYTSDNKVIQESDTDSTPHHSKSVQKKLVFVYGLAKLHHQAHSWGWIAEAALKH